VDQRIALVGVRPVDEGLAGLVVVVGDDLDCCGQGDEPADLSDLGDELGDGVLGRDGVVEEGRVKRPLVLSPEDAGLGDDIATSAGIEGRPRVEGNRSSKRSSGNRSLRWSAKKASTEPCGTSWRQSAIASRSSLLASECPCIHQVSVSNHVETGINSTVS